MTVSYHVVLHQTKLLTPELSCTVRTTQLTTVFTRLGSVRRNFHQPAQIQVRCRLKWGPCKVQGVAVVNDSVTKDRSATLHHSLGCSCRRVSIHHSASCRLQDLRVHTICRRCSDAQTFQPPSSSHALVCIRAEAGMTSPAYRLCLLHRVGECSTV